MVDKGEGGSLYSAPPPPLTPLKSPSPLIIFMVSFNKPRTKTKTKKKLKTDKQSNQTSKQKQTKKQKQNNSKRTKQTTKLDSVVSSLSNAVSTSKRRTQILRSIVTSTFLYACETWTLTAELGRKIQTFEMRCYRKIFGISFRDRITNEDVRNRVSASIGPHDDLLSIVKTRKLRWYGHVTRATGLANTIMQGTVPGGRRRGRPKKCWHDNIKEWMELPLAKTLRLAEDKDGWSKIINKSVVPLQPSQRLKGEDETQ